MSDTPSQTAQTEDLVVKRILDAPLERVWQAWADPEQVMRWWGPKYYTCPSARIDLRQGGRYVFAMRAPQEQGAQVSYISGVYKVVVPMQLLEFGQSLSDEDGNLIDPAQEGMPPGFPLETRTTVAFRTIRDMTELTVTEYDWPVSQMMIYSFAGLHQMVDKLSEALSRES